MPKWKLVDDAEAPEDLSQKSPEAREKLEMLRALVPGKTLVLQVETTAQRGFKAALTRESRKQDMSVISWSNGDQVCLRLMTEEEIAKEAAKQKKEQTSA